MVQTCGTDRMTISVGWGIACHVSQRTNKRTLEQYLRIRTETIIIVQKRIVTRARRSNQALLTLQIKVVMHGMNNLGVDDNPRHAIAIAIRNRI